MNSKQKRLASTREVYPRYNAAEAKSAELALDTHSALLRVDPMSQDFRQDHA